MKMTKKAKQAANRKYREKAKERKRLAALEAQPVDVNVNVDANGSREASKEQILSELALAQKTIQFLSQKLQAEIEMRLAMGRRKEAAVEEMKLEWRPSDRPFEADGQRREFVRSTMNNSADTISTISTNPKTLMGLQKVPMLSVIPPASLVYQGIAMRYGAFLAKKADGGHGYGPYNWRDQPIEAEVYIDAAVRHLLQFQDGDDDEVIYGDDGGIVTTVPHLAFALASLGILIDAIANETVIDNRPKVKKKAATDLLDLYKLQAVK